VIRPATGGEERLVLAVETTAPRSGAALARAGTAGLVAEAYGPARAPAETLAGCVRAVLERAGTGAESLFGLAAVDGPGSYTGLRVGLALVRGMALADDLPVAAVGSLELIAAAAPPDVSRVCALLDASHGKVYAAGYERDGAGLVEAHAPVVADADDLALTLQAWGGPWTVCGDAALSQVVALDAVVADARAALLARLGALALLGGRGRAADTVLPRYVGAVGARPQSTAGVRGRVLVR
jgi:tRNA threonylcarbamoyladenosine biosynthesis protein TsaB